MSRVIIPKRPRSFLCAFVIAVSGCVSGGLAAQVDPVDELIREQMSELSIPGVSVAVVRSGEVLKVGAYGVANLELRTPVSPETLFPYASITKVLTATAIVQLVAAGKVSLDDTVGELFPDLPATWSASTVDQLLAHTSGLPNIVIPAANSNPYVAKDAWLGDSEVEALRQVSSLPPEFPPGSGVAYNQTGYLLLAKLLRERDGRTIEQYVDEEFAGPLGLHSFAFGDSRVAVPGRASWYTRIDLSSGIAVFGPPRPLWIEYPDHVRSAAGLNGTALDLARFVAAVALGHPLGIGEDARQEMWSPSRLSDGHPARFEGSALFSGLGWFVDDNPSHEVISSSGAASGALKHYVAEELTVVVLTNLQGAEPERLANRIAQLFIQ